MSDILLDLAEPLLLAAETREKKEEAITLGAVAWTISLLPEDAHVERIYEALDLFKVPEASHPVYVAILQMLVDRKKEMFPHVRRTILNYELTFDKGGEPYLRVISTLDSLSP